MRNPISMLARLVSGAESEDSASNTLSEATPAPAGGRDSGEGLDVASPASHTETPIPMVLYCPTCGVQHIDAPDAERGWTNPPHRSHLCLACGTIWRPAEVATTGVAALQRLGADDTWAPGDRVSAATSAGVDEEAAADGADEAQCLRDRMHQAESISPLQAELLELREQYALETHPEYKAELDVLRETVQASEREIESLRSRLMTEDAAARIAELEEGLHYAHGTADLAMQHRDAAEARVAELEAGQRETLAQIEKLTAALEQVAQEGEARNQQARALLAQIHDSASALVPLRTSLSAMPHWALSRRAKVQLLALCQRAERALESRAAAASAAAVTSSTPPSPSAEAEDEPGKRRRKRSRKKKASA